MASVNKCILIGNLTRDVEVKYMPNGDAVANFSIATNERWKDKNGNNQEKVEYHNIVMYRRLAEIAGEYLKKGRPVYIEGRLQTRKWEKDGVERYSTEIIGDQLQMLGNKDDQNTTSSNSSDNGNAAPAQPAGGANKPADPDDDIPFSCAIKQYWRVI